MFGRFIIAFSLFQLCFCCAYAQVNLTGYINNYSLLGETRPDPFDETLWQNMTSQRFNFNWSINNNFDIFISSRTNFSIGNSTILKIIKETSTDDDNLMKLSYSLIDKDDKWLGIALDRLALRWATDDFEITLGRQRINWGNTILWNPNDIFDSSPVINFTYPEKMGCDAVRARFYHSEVATSEIALSADRDGSPTAALLHRNNFRKFDYQLLGGVYKGHYLFAGGGFTTELKNINIRFEGSYFHDYRKLSDKPDVVQLSLGIDKLFSNNLILQTEVLYTNKPYDISDIVFSYLPVRRSVRELTTSRWSFAGQIYYPFSKLCSINSLIAYFHDQEAIYVGAEMTYHVFKNFDLSLMINLFDYTLGQSYSMDGIVGALHLKYYF